MTDIIGFFRKGQDISVFLDAPSDDTSEVSEVTAKMRPVRSYTASVVFGPGDPVDMTVEARAAAGAVPAGWTLTIPASVTADLAAGAWGIDARLEIGSGVVITDRTAVIELSEAAIS